MSLRVTIICDRCSRGEEVDSDLIAANSLPRGWRKYEVGQLFREPWKTEHFCEECAAKEDE